MAVEHACSVCGCPESKHVMAGNILEWRKRGDYCTVCRKGCRAGGRAA